jgi:hypothetical protein
MRKQKRIRTGRSDKGGRKRQSLKMLAQKPSLVATSTPHCLPLQLLNTVLQTEMADSIL